MARVKYVAKSKHSNPQTASAAPNAEVTETLERPLVEREPTPVEAESPPSPTLPAVERELGTAESDTMRAVYGEYLNSIKYLPFVHFGTRWEEEEDLKLLYLRSKDVYFTDIADKYLGRTLPSVKRRHQKINSAVAQMNNDDKEALNRALEQTGRRLGMEI